MDLKCGAFLILLTLEVLYRKFLKELLGVNKCTTNAMVYGETGMMPVSKLILSRATNYFMNICNGKRTKLSYIMYKLLRCKQENHTLYQSHWLNNVEQNLSGIGMRDLWLSEGFGFTNDYVKHAIKLRQKDVYFQEWSAEMNTKKSCEMYRVIKTDFGLENYLMQSSYYQRSSLSKFRCRNNRRL